MRQVSFKVSCLKRTTGDSLPAEIEFCRRSDNDGIAEIVVNGFIFAVEVDALVSAVDMIAMIGDD